MRCSHALSAGAGLGLAISLAGAAPPAPVELRCQFTPGQTNAYRVTFETSSGEQPSTVAGIIFVHVRKVEEGVGTIGFSGNLAPRSGPGANPMMGMPFRAFAAAWWPRHVAMQPNSDIRVNESGQVVRQWAHSPGLPAPFGGVMGLFFQVLPAQASAEWQSAALVLIEDETADDEMSGRFIGPYGDRRSGYELTAKRSEQARLTEVSDTTVTMETRVELVSLQRAAGEPRFKAVREGQVVLDRRTGWIRSADFAGQSVITTPHLTLRRPMKLHLCRLEGDELAKELAALQPVEAPPAKISRAELPGLLRDLDALDESARMTAISRFQSGEVEEVTPELLAAAVKLAGASGAPERAAANHLLGRHGTAEQVPAMLKLVAWAQPGSQREVIEALGRLKDQRAIKPLADLIARGNYDAEFIVQLLQRFGPAAEPAALDLFKERHAQTRRLACVVLGEIGTRKSTDTLREQMLDPDEQVAQAATQALRAIQQRESGAVEVR